MSVDINNVNDLVEIFKRRKYLFLLTASVIFLFTVVLAFAWPPTYRSSATILIEDQEVPRDFVSTTVTSYAEQRLQQINQRIMGTTRLIQVINKFNLYPDLKNKWTTEEIIEKLRKDIKLANISADVIDPRSGNPRQATIAFTIAYKGKNPQTVQQVATELTSLYLEENLKVREKQSQGTTNFMEDEMKAVQERLAEADSQLATFKKRHINSLPELSQVNLQSIESTDRELVGLNYQLRTLREKEGALQSKLASIPVDANSTDKARLNELRVKLSELKSRLTDEHPDVSKTKLEIADLYRKLRSSSRETTDDKPDNPVYIALASELSGIKSDIDSTKKQIETFTRKKEDYQHRIAATPLVEEGYKKIIGQRNNFQLKYDDLSKKFMEARVSSGMEKEQKGERFTLIDAARLPEMPISPNIPAILFIGLMLSLAAGTGLVVFTEQNDHTFRSVDSLEKATNLPVLAGIPRLLTVADITARKAFFRKTIAALVIVMVISPLLVHFLVMDLDIFWIKLLRRTTRF